MSWRPRANSLKILIVCRRGGNWISLVLGRFVMSAIGLAKTEDADAKACRVQASYDFPGVGHLRVGKSLVSKAVYQDANGVHAHLAGQRRSDGRNAAMLSGNPGS